MHSTLPTCRGSAVRLFASARSWIQSEAVRQLYTTSKLNGVRLAVGFPDLHPGKSSPVGAAFVTEEVIYPGLIGGDIGCGMALFKTDLVQRQARFDSWMQIPFDLEHAWTDNVGEVLKKENLQSTAFDEALGTLGSGNHFVELQIVEEVINAGDFRKLRLYKKQIVVLVHTGSRGLGKSVLQDYLAGQQGAGSDADSFASVAYLKGHSLAVRWAKVNRKILAKRFAEALQTEAELLWDGCHNSITPRELEGETVWVHRKGAVIAEDEAVVIPGSRGSLSYLVKPLGDGQSRAWSLAHGAGRKWARSEARLRMRGRFEKQQLVQTALGSHVICGRRDLLYEEAPETYKNIDAVIQDLVDARLISVIAVFRPLLTYKCRASTA